MDMKEKFPEKKNDTKLSKDKVIIKKCHVCGQVSETTAEIERCIKCNKAFLPLKYFMKVHEQEDSKLKDLFASSDELDEKDLIKGIYVLW